VTVPQAEAQTVPAAMHYATRSGLAIGALKTILDMAPVSTAEQIAAYAAGQLAELEGPSVA
jgi:hypothetical protein